MLPIKVYNGPHGQGPNPWKVIILLEELGLPYDIVWIPYGEIKSEPYTSLNPNGRLPSIIDPNKSITLWETGAIINYLIAMYDKELKLSYGDDRLQECWHLQSWLMFQVSGQGPMWGQKMWFTHIHVEQNLQTAIDRYGNESKRIMGVVDSSLRKQRQRLGLTADDPVWLVGEKCTYADLAFASWNTLLPTIFPGGTLDLEKEFPEYYRWNANMLKRPATRKVLDFREECIRSMKDTGMEVVERQVDARQLPRYEKSLDVGVA
ncbi:glutathione transferase [Hypoxylon sp. FL0543]|nr:glutathione transferase [Hypoxylon sp. FL0543]